MADTLLSLNGLDAFYGDFQALFDINMQIQAGEVVAIIGANGAGKSTLMRSITGLLGNQAEQIAFNGQSIGARRPDQVAHLGIAMVPEGRKLFPSLSVEENLKIGATATTGGYWTLDTIYSLFPILQERRMVPSTSLSGGQQQMVAIGRALMSNPKLILFDEISLGLAPVVINAIYAAIPEILNQGMTALIVEQDLTRALSVATRLYCLQEGRVKLEGRTEEVSREQITAAYFGVAA